MVKLKPLWTLLKLLLLLLLLVVIFFAVWLRQGPKSLNWAKPFLLNRLNSADAAYTVNAGDMAIDWRDLSRLGLVRVKNVNLSGPGGAAFASLPEIYVSLDLFGFLPQRRILNSIYIQKPRFFLTRDKEKNLRLGLQGSDTSIKPLAELDTTSKPVKPWDGRLPFRHLKLDDLHLVISDEVTGRQLTSSSGSVEIGRRFGSYTGHITLPFTYGAAEGSVNATINTLQRGTHVMDMALARVPTDYICVFASCPGGLEFSGIIDGKLRLVLDEQLKPYGGQGNLETEKLTVIAPEWFPEPLKMKRSSIAVESDAAMKRVKLTKLELDLEDTYLTATAEAEKKVDGWYVSGRGNADKLNIDKLYKYWPITLAADSRAWVTSSLKGGFGEESTIKFKLTPKDFINPSIADDAIDATVQARGITVHYISGFPEMNNVNGVVKFTGSTIDVDATSGSMLSGTTISKTRIAFPDLNKPETPMEIETTLSAPASDAATLLKLEHFEFDDALELNPATIQGQVDGVLKLNFDAFSQDTPDSKPTGNGQVNFDAVKYDIDLDLKDMTQHDFAGLFDLAGGHGKLAATNDGMSFDGAVKLGATNEVKVKVLQRSGEDAKLLIDGGLSRSDFASLGLPDDRRFGEGTLKMLADITAMKDEILLNSATIDLSDMAFSIPEISWQKRRGTPATIILEPKGKSYKLDIKAPGLSVPNATLSLTPGLDVKELHLPHVKTVSSDFSLRYAMLKEGFEATLSGDMLDASMSYSAPGNEGAENTLLSDFPPIRLSIDLGALILMPDYPLSQVNGTLICSKIRCESANITARASNADIKAMINYAEGKRQFILTASNAGDFLRALDITDRMYNGVLELKGTYDDTLTPPALPARLMIQKFTLQNSQILGRILSIGSLTGLSNALTGSGIAFDKLTGDIYSHEGLIVVKNGKVSGNAIGITIGGNVDTRKSTLNLKGTLVPAAALNTLIGKIPLIGKLAGGDEGLIAFNFAVKGPQADPNVSVNPFSGLTPGFLRGIWGDNEVGDESDTKREPVTTRRHQRGIGQ